ncbi:AraC family transcriptional regulator ligand-binding domain-containing protein [Phenylobacterium sp.]|uniref:AraC family transcriptional regulator n=1 Tax=Phenylobacterium sp. TaxID=1871053 RepID=UPI0028126595|nr:AraC family transcriptional regulator ligand-binding domain-containing protein [Phenylobacterium sp.]
MTEPTVGAGFVRGLLEFAVRRGVDRQALAARAGLDLAALRDEDARLPFSAYVALMKAAQAMTGDPALSLRYGADVNVAEISIVGLIGQASTNALEAFVQLNRYVPLIVETENEGGGDRFRMQMDCRGLWIVDARLHPNDFPELTESAFAHIVCSPRQHGHDLVVKAVHVTHPDPGYRHVYEEVFGCPVVFEADRNAFLIDPSWPDARLQHLPRYAFDVLSGHAEGLLASLASTNSVRGAVEKHLAAMLHTGEVSVDAVAERMAVSRQTLYRKLKAEGVTFEQVLEQLREKLALRYLKGRKVSVNETAYLVGFSDPAAFSRAFKRWTGMSPREARLADA